MRRKLRWSCARNQVSADGKTAIGFGIRVGYWPCLEAPYVQCTFLFWHFDAWHGYPSWQQVAASEF
jgi:hypothetical protein